MSGHIAYDPGFGAIKLYSHRGSLVMQSAVSVGDAQQISRMAGLRITRQPLKIETDGGIFHVGPNAHDWGRPVENLDFDRLTGSPEMMALWYGALTKYRVPDDSIELIVGLPIHVLTGSDAETTQQAVRDALRRKHTWEADGQRHSIRVASVRITSQPVGAMFDYLLTDEGQMPADRRKAFKRELGVFSVGMNTVELLVVRNGSPVQRFIAGETLGVRRLLELVNHLGLYSLAELDAQLRDGTLDIGGVLPIWQSEVLGFVERQWGEAFKRFQIVVAVGGGAKILREPILRRFKGRVFIPDDPIIATARGLYKYTVMLARRKR